MFTYTMSVRTVYYFCTRHLRGTGSYYYNELVCKRIVYQTELHERINQLEKEYWNKGTIHVMTYPYGKAVDRVWEEQQIKESAHWDFSRSFEKLTVESTDETSTQISSAHTPSR